jgi:pimeloyl-ACP methyl ester carboxylesterase
MLRRFVPALALLAFVTDVRADDRFFDSNGVKIRYTVQGQGEPVVLIHGFAANLDLNWGLPGVIKALARDYRVIAIDNRGHGKSGKPHSVDQYGMEMVEDAVRLLDQLKIKKAHFVGYSMGAMLVNKLVVTHPDRVLTAVLGGAAGVRAGAKLAFFEALADSLEKGKGMAPLIVGLTPIGKQKPTAGQIAAINKVIVAGNDTKALAAVVRSWKNLAITTDQFKSNRIPTLAIVGGTDPLRKSVEAIQGLMGGLEQVIVLPGADHMTALVHAEFVPSLRRFLAKHKSSP